MGNRSSGSRSKKRDHIYKNPEPSDKTNYTNNAQDRSYSGASHPYHQQSTSTYPNGHGNYHKTNSVSQSLNQHPLSESFPSPKQNSRSTSNTQPARTGTPTSSNGSKSNTSKLIYVANYDFVGTPESGELSFDKGDKLEILDRKTYHDWWRAKNQRTQKSGYVPANYISAINDLTAYEWYFTDTNRRDAERFLEQPHNGQGTFLIRPSDTNQGQESLSVLDLTKDKHFHVKHYRIRRTRQGLYYISEKHQLPTLADLVNHYRNHADGLCCLLTRPCRKTEPTVPADRHGLLELDRRQLTREILLGRGNYGEVYRGKYGHRDVAIKCMKNDSKNRLCNVDKFLEEAKMMKDLLHKNIVRLYGVCAEGEPIYIVTEYIPNGCLLNYLRDDRSRDLKFKTILDFAAQIASGMAYLEQKRYVHCDLAARNILVGESDVVKIADFGLAKILQGGRLMVDREAQFPIKWTAPEAANRKEYTNKSDVWSFGILLYELITRGSNPYPGMSNSEALQSVLNGYRMPKPKECHDYYYQLMTSCWQENPDNRPTFETLFMRLDDFMVQSEGAYRET